MGTKNYPYWWFYQKNRFWHWERHESSGERVISNPFETLNACRADALARGYQVKGPGGRVRAAAPLAAVR